LCAESVTVKGQALNDRVFEVNIPVAGRYRVDVSANGEGVINIEDYIHNTDGRTYDITGDLTINAPEKAGVISRDGSPLDVGRHDMKINLHEGNIDVESITFTLLKKHKLTPAVQKQNLEGDEWSLVWSDEFENDGAPDPRIWTYEVGNWGWGNREPEYYTEDRRENARCEDGKLIVEARKDRKDGGWSSARITTSGRLSFLYGRIEFRAKTSAGDGCWPAVWLLGDAYRDEISWPYCGEVDILEAVGRNIDDETGAGKTGFACHTRAYYFKQKNHISSHIQVEDLTTRFHDYVMEWTPESIQIFFDGKPVYLYDHTANELEFPFNHPQNFIINIAMGGSNGRAIDPALTAQRIELEYLRVYGRK
jgi:beta-glucanase (GH16 family)